MKRKEREQGANERTLTLFLFLSSPSLRSFSSQECSFPQESYTSSSSSLFTHFFHLAIFSLSLQPPLRSLYPESSPFVPLAPPSRSSYIRVPPRFTILSLPPKRTRPRSLSSYSPFSSRGEQKLRIREAFVESRGSIEGFRSAVRELRANHHVSYRAGNV